LDERGGKRPDRTNLKDDGDNTLNRTDDGRRNLGEPGEKKVSKKIIPKGARLRVDIYG